MNCVVRDTASMIGGMSPQLQVGSLCVLQYRRSGAQPSLHAKGHRLIRRNGRTFVHPARTRRRTAVAQRPWRRADRRRQGLSRTFATGAGAGRYRSGCGSTWPSCASSRLSTCDGYLPGCVHARAGADARLCEQPVALVRCQPTPGGAKHRPSRWRSAIAKPTILRFSSCSSPDLGNSPAGVLAQKH
jgi:hypothetical protein